MIRSEAIKIIRDFYHSIFAYKCGCSVCAPFTDEKLRYKLNQNK